jgi:soluble lytic murein transglycosylase-like protein
MRERELRDLARQMAERYGIDPDIYVRLIETESSFNPTARNERTGATGLAQVMGPTAQDPGFGVTPLRDRLDPVENLRFGAEYLAAMLRKYDGDYSRALAAYNAGPGRVDQAGGIPDFEETKNYVARILQGPGRPQSRPMNLMREEGQPMRPEPRGFGGPIAEQRNQAIRQALMEAAGARPEGIMGLGGQR